MARIRNESDEEELPTLAEILKSTKRSSRKPKHPSTSRSLDSRGRITSLNSFDNYPIRNTENRGDEESKKEKTRPARPQQRLLKRVEHNSVLLQPLKISKDISELEKRRKRDTEKSLETDNQTSELKQEEYFQNEQKTKVASKQQDEESEEAYRARFGCLSEIRSLGSPQMAQTPLETPRTVRQKARPFKIPPPLDGSQLSEAPNPSPKFINSRPTSASSVDHAAVLIYEPPRRISPHKASPLRPTTPPQSPTKAKLTSPSKGKPQHIPTHPLQPDLDAFWSQDVINDWNDQYSPRKPITSPRKNRFTIPEDSDDEGYTSPSASPRKGSPVKKDRKAIEAKKAFDASKHKAAEDFLFELDSKIAGGKIAELAAPAGGVKIIWSKKLNSTAGRANWRRECTRVALADGTIDKTYKHFASIELAEKVIDDEERLINVLAHEFCHLANFMVSGVKDNPHGKEFKIWAAKTSRAFSHRNVLVTTKHSYAIDYKYVWECTSCGYEFKRHSKSIDPLRHTCGSCKSKLVQTKPAVRNTKVSEYQLFVKEHFQRVKRENGGLTHGGVMEVLGREYREKKGRTGAVIDDAVDVGGVGDRKEMDEVVRALDIVTLGD